MNLILRNISLLVLHALKINTTVEDKQHLSGQYNISRNATVKPYLQTLLRKQSIETNPPDFYTGTLQIERNVNESLPRYCSYGRAICHQYIKRMVHFYKKIGGWLMLGVITLGIISLWVSIVYGRYLGRRYTNRHHRKHRWAFSTELIYKVNGRTHYLTTRKKYKHQNKDDYFS